jgi:starch synthase
MKILIATPEAVPYAKTGGLADVAGTLLKEFRQRGLDASLVLPLYGSVKRGFELFRTRKTFTVKTGGTAIKGEVLISDRSSSPQAYFVECDALYDRPEFYGSANGDYSDNALRFAFFSRAVLETCRVMDLKPDVIHCNEWQTAMVPLYLRNFYADRSALSGAAVLFTVHNLGYQGIFPASDIRFTGLGRDFVTPERLEFYGKLNFLKAGLIYSDLINTVSSTYAREILDSENGFGLDGVLRTRKDDLYGVVNGIDYDEWDPSADLLIPARYSSGNIRGKQRCRKELLSRTGLTDDKSPIFGIVSRFSSQKGLDLVADAADRIVAMGGRIVIVGRGDEHYRKLLEDVSKRNSGRVSVTVGFEEKLAHLIYAGSDFFLMPSRYEPCGLGQLIAMRYGSIPVVRKTGGLADTVRDCDSGTPGGTGFFFSEYSPDALLGAARRALDVFGDKKRMRMLVSNAMKADFSWGRSAAEYLELYKKAVEKVR